MIGVGFSKTFLQTGGEELIALSRLLTKINARAAKPIHVFVLIRRHQTRSARRRMTQPSKPRSDVENSSATSPTQEATENSETACEVFMKLISGDPQFRPAKPSGKAFVVGGAKPLAK